MATTAGHGKQVTEKEKEDVSKAMKQKINVMRYPAASSGELNPKRD